jgi:hypothetical protein
MNWHAATGLHRERFRVDAVLGSAPPALEMKFAALALRQGTRHRGVSDGGVVRSRYRRCPKVGVPPFIRYVLDGDRRATLSSCRRTRNLFTKVLEPYWPDISGQPPPQRLGADLRPVRRSRGGIDELNSFPAVTVEEVVRDDPPSGMLLRVSTTGCRSSRHGRPACVLATSDVASSVGDLLSWRPAYSRRLA